MNKVLVPSCSICYFSLKIDLAYLECGHVFHKECINIALKNRRKCPLCRKDVTNSQLLFYEFNTLKPQNLELINIFLKQSNENSFEICQKLQIETNLLQKEIIQIETEAFQYHEQYGQLKNRIRQQKWLNVHELERKTTLKSQKDSLNLQFNKNGEQFINLQIKIQQLFQLKDTDQIIIEEYNTIKDNVSQIKNKKKKVIYLEQQTKQQCETLQNLKNQIEDEQKEMKNLNTENQNLQISINSIKQSQFNPEQILRKSKRIKQIKQK